jgi:uncharacterized metal-binding protein
MTSSVPNCAACPFKPDERICRTEGGRSPENCPTINKAELVEVARGEYQKTENAEFARQASLHGARWLRKPRTGYAKVRPAKPRIEETLDFIGKMGYKKIGLAFCLACATRPRW